MPRKNKPKCLKFSPEQIEALLDRIQGKCLQEEDYELLIELIQAMVWLNLSLQNKELSIRRLQAVFGIKTESAKRLIELAKKKSPCSGTDNGNKGKSDSQGDIQEKSDSGEEKASEDAPKGRHGHRSSTDYTDAKTIPIAHNAFKKGDSCPACHKGKLFQLKPGTVLHIVGQPWLQVNIYQPERLRCSLCGRVFTALLPKEIAVGSRADTTAKAIVSLLKYRCGVPFYRQEQLQKVLGTPSSASEIWEMTRDVAHMAEPIYAAMCVEAANAELIQNDDTTAKILSVMHELKEKQKEGKEKKTDRKGMYTTAILASSRLTGTKIALFFTGRKHAGENLDRLLEKRAVGMPAPIQECDALSRNIPKNHDTQVGNCLAHARRDFYELAEMWPTEVVKIIGWFAGVFVNDKKAPKDPQKRLEWHQARSLPILNELKSYCDGLVNNKEVEPNSALGKAIAYLNNHWKGLTLFTRIPGVPLTNNDTEQLMKRAVLNRKNAYFFRNEAGAHLADILMSVIETCVLNNENPYYFLVAIQKHADDVYKDPHLWLPWNYRKRLIELEPP